MRDPQNAKLAKATAIYVPRVRALSDAERIFRALTFIEIVTGDADPDIVGIWRTGPSVLDDLGGGRIVCTTPYRALLSVTTGAAYLP